MYCVLVGISSNVLGTSSFSPVTVGWIRQRLELAFLSNLILGDRSVSGEGYLQGSLHCLRRLSSGISSFFSLQSSSREQPVLLDFNIVRSFARRLFHFEISSFISVFLLSQFSAETKCPATNIVLWSNTAATYIKSSTKGAWVPC